MMRKRERLREAWESAQREVTRQQARLALALRDVALAREAFEDTCDCGWDGGPVLPRGVADASCPACGDDWPTEEERSPGEVQAAHLGTFGGVRR